MHRHELKFGGRFPQARQQHYASISKAGRPGQSASKRSARRATE